MKENGFYGEMLKVVVMDARVQGRQTLLDSMYCADGMSLMDGVAIAASIGMLLGVIYGSRVYIGPIALGLAGMVAGGGIGYLLDRRINTKKTPREKAPSGEVILIARCNDADEVQRAENIMKEHRASALGRCLALVDNQ